MILSGNEIRNQIKAGRISITPADALTINPASVDLTLGREVAVYEDFTHTVVGTEWERVKGPTGSQGFGAGPYDGRGLLPKTATALDVKKPAAVMRWDMDPKVGWILQPGIGYLMHTAERVHTDHFVPILDGKSSIGRLFVKVHETAGFGDPGFNGQYTLEVTSLFPVRVYPGMRFCQIRFHSIEGDVLSYQDTGRYKGRASEGAIASRIHETFKS